MLQRPMKEEECPKSCVYLVLIRLIKSCSILKARDGLCGDHIACHSFKKYSSPEGGLHLTCCL